jgi:ubiquinone/menaquinone biosynthesis C-methylase UbiE
MSTPINPRREQPNTYVMQNRFHSDDDELKRLLIHDQIFTAGMGGVLPEQVDPTRFARVLDVGCGPGCWLIEVARTYPSMSLLIGADISNKMMDYAREQARVEQVDDRVEFQQMDALRMLEFPTEFFDLVNERFGIGWLRTWEWPKFLQECQRVTRPGGVIRITEFNVLVESNSPALTCLGELAMEAFDRSGHLFTPRGDGVTKELPHLLSKHGVQGVQTRAYALEHRADTPEGQLFVEDWRRLYRGIVPFLRQWTRLPDDYEDIYQQMLQETQQPDFVATSRIMTAWGTRSATFSLPVEI